MPNFSIESGFTVPRRQYNFSGKTCSPYRSALEAMLPKESIRITTKKDVDNFRGMATRIKKDSSNGRKFTFRTLGPSEWRVWRM